MHEQDNYIEDQIKIQDLLMDLKYIDSQIQSLKDDVKYVTRLIGSFNIELEKIKEALCPNSDG